MASPTPSVAAPTTPSNIAEWVMTQTEGILSDAINGPMQALFEALMPVIVVGLDPPFLTYAFTLKHGQSNMTVTQFFRKAILVAILFTIFGAGGLYQNDIAKTMISLPDDVTQLALG